MLLVKAQNIKKYYGDRLIIGFDEFKVYSGDRIGIIGLNGSGKSTFLNILSGDLKPDEGIVKQYYPVSYIRQLAEEGIEANGKELRDFGLSEKTEQTIFSGGEQSRIRIANAFSTDALVLFADEPTANLDYKGIEALKQKLDRMESFLLISHDRYLLDRLCNKIVEIKDGRLRVYNGSYSVFKSESSKELKQKELEYQKYVSGRESLEAAIKERQAKSKALKKAPSRMGNSEARLHKRETTEIQKKLYRAANGLKTRLDKLEVKEKPKEMPRIKLDFSLTRPPENRIVISADKLSFSYSSLQIFDSADFKIYNGSKTALWGDNGSGKSTLLSLISSRANDRIYVVPKAKIGYFYQGFENLDYNRSVLDNVMKDSVQNQTIVRTILSRLLISGDDVHKRVGVLSGGERIKVSFAKLFVSDCNVLLLDEPTNYLDMGSIEALQDVLANYEGTAMFVSHDSEFVNTVADRLLVFKNKKILEFEGSLAEYEKKAVQNK